MEKSTREFIKAFREALPPLCPQFVVRCPTKNLDGSPIDENDIQGCGSPNVVWSGDVYDCLDCGIFFCDFAANPPHRREEE